MGTVLRRTRTNVVFYTNNAFNFAGRNSFYAESLH